MVSKQSAKNSVLRAMANAYILQELHDSHMRQDSSKDESTILSLIDMLKNKSTGELSFMVDLQTSRVNLFLSPEHSRKANQMPKNEPDSVPEYYFS